MATGVMTLVLVAALLVWQVGEKPTRVDTIRPLPLPAGPTTSDEPRRFADYDGTSRSAADQCSLPLHQRTGGWICPESLLAPMAGL